MKLSEFELEIMQLFWEAGEASAPELHKLIAAERDVSYSTVKTIIDRLEKKGAIRRSRQEGRTIYHQALLKKASYTKPVFQRFLKIFFGGQKRSLLNHLLADETLNKDDIAYLEKLIKQKKRELEDK